MVGGGPPSASQERGDRGALTRRAVLAVFGTLQELLGSPTGQGGEAWDIMSQLPMDLKRLWLAASEAGKS